MTVETEQQVLEAQQAPEPTELEKEISANAELQAQAEHQALQIDERLKAVPGLERYLSEPRRYGVIRNPWVDGNVTAVAKVSQADRELAVWMASKAGATLPPIDYAAQAAEEQRQAGIQRMAEETARLREQRMTRQAAIDHAVNLGYWSADHGRAV